MSGANGSQCAGWYGKLPSCGDFANRRLASDLIQIWDAWLCQGLMAMQRDNPDHWLESYLASPTWRFVVQVGFLPAPFGATAWSGVVMPSVDRVGRYFPLTIMTPLTAIPATTAGQVRLWSWLQSLDDAAIDALQDDWSIAELDAELLRLGLPASCLDHANDNAVADYLAPAASQFFSTFTRVASSGTGISPGASAWYSHPDRGEPRVLHIPLRDGAIASLWQRIPVGTGVGAG
jgi:type VI secretion system protein ImpM